MELPTEGFWKNSHISDEATTNASIISRLPLLEALLELLM
jgi:hypothetical protein